MNSVELREPQNAQPNALAFSKSRPTFESGEVRSRKILALQPEPRKPELDRQWLSESSVRVEMSTAQKQTSQTHLPRRSFQSRRSG